MAFKSSCLYHTQIKLSYVVALFLLMCVRPDACRPLTAGSVAGWCGLCFLSSLLAPASELPGSEHINEREMLLVCLWASQQSWGKSVYSLQYGNSDNGFVNWLYTGALKIVPPQFWFHFISAEFPCRLSRDFGAKWWWSVLNVSKANEPSPLHKYWNLVLIFLQICTTGAKLY